MAREARKRLATEILCRIAERLPDWQVGALPTLKFFASKRREDSVRMSVRCPEGIKVRPAFVSYYDLFFTEDFTTLQRGLARLCSDHKGRSQPFIFSPQNDFDELFRSWSQHPSGGSRKRVGHFQFGEKSPLNCAESISVDLISISPVCVLLHASAFPQESYVKRFHKLISQNVENTAIVHRFGVFSRKWHSRGVLPSIVRQHELEEMFLELNREVVVLLREYIGRGWSANGPLPSFQVFALDELGEDSKEPHSEFWRSLSLTRIPELSYSDSQGLEIVPPYWLEKGTFTTPYRCLVDTKQYLTEERTKGYATRDYAMYYNMENDVIFPLLPLLALRESATQTIEKLRCLRDRVSPLIVMQRGVLAKLQAALGLLLVPPRLNSLQFEVSRTQDSSVQKILETPPDLPFTRRVHSDESKIALTDDLVFQIRTLSNHVREHVGLIRNAYHDLWNFTIQWILIILTVAATVIAVVQLVPKKDTPGSTAQQTEKAESGKGELLTPHRVARGGYPPPAPTERSVRISRTTLFRNRFTAQRVIAVPYREAPILAAAKENEP